MRSRPLTLTAFGIVLVVCDPRVLAVDPLLDPAGWALVAFGAWRLAFTWPYRLAGVAALASVADVALPYRYDAIDPITGEVVQVVGDGSGYNERLAVEAVEGARLALMVLAVVAGGLALWFLLRGLQMRAASMVRDDDRIVRRLGRLRWAVALFWVLPYAAVALVQALDGGDGFDPVWNGGLELVGLVGLAVAIAVALVLGTHANKRWSASGGELGSPWAELMVQDMEI